MHFYQVCLMILIQVVSDICFEGKQPLVENVLILVWHDAYIPADAVGIMMVPINAGVRVVGGL